MVRCWNAKFARHCSENFPCRRNGETREVFPVLQTGTKQNYCFAEQRFQSHLQCCGFALPSMGAPGVHGAHYIAGSQWLSSVLLKVKRADHRGANMVAPGKWYSNLALLPTVGHQLTQVFPSVRTSRDVPWTSELGKETWARLAVPPCRDV